MFDFIGFNFKLGTIERMMKMNDTLITRASAAIFAAKLVKKKTVLINNSKSLTKRTWVENHYGVTERNRKRSSKDIWSSVHHSICQQSQKN